MYIERNGERKSEEGGEKGGREGRREEGRKGGREEGRKREGRREEGRKEWEGVRGCKRMDGINGLVIRDSSILCSIEIVVS